MAPDMVVLVCISIHALREEGDPDRDCGRGQQAVFLSTPSARRATGDAGLSHHYPVISIHALREEGDGFFQMHTSE